MANCITSATPSPAGGISRERILGAVATLSILIVSTGMKASFIGKKEIWLDESYSCFIASRPFGEMMTFVRGDIHPPLYYFLLKAWTSIFGSSPVSVKSLSVFFSVVACVIFYYVAKKIVLDRWISIFCLFLFAFSPVLFYYSVEARMYMLSVLFSVMTLYFFHDIINNDEFSLRRGLMFLLCCTGLFYVHYIGIFLIIGYFGYYVFSNTSRNVKIKYIICSGLILIPLTFPWIPILYHQKVNLESHQQAVVVAKEEPETLNYHAEGNATNLPVVSFMDILSNDVENMASLLGVYPFSNVSTLLTLNIVFLVLSIFFLLSTCKNNRIGRMLLILGMIYYIIAIFLQIHSRRSYILLTPIMILALGIVLLEINKKYRNVVLFGFLIASLSLSYVGGVWRIYNKKYCHMNESLVRYLESRYEKNDIIVFNSIFYEVPFDYHARESAIVFEKRGFPIGIYEWWKSQEFKGWGGPIVTKRALEKFTDQLSADSWRGSLWLILFESSYYDPGNQLLERLKDQSISWESRDQELDPCDGERESDLHLYKFRMFPPKRST